MQPMETEIIDLEGLDQTTLSPALAEVISLNVFSNNSEGDNGDSGESADSVSANNGASGAEAAEIMVKRLSDLLLLPIDQFTPSERGLVSEILTRLLSQVSERTRARLALRVARMADPPVEMLQKLAWDEFDIAEPILKESVNICDFDLIAIAQDGSRQHRQAIVSRKKLTSAVAEALIESDDVVILEQLLRNEGIVFSQRIMASLAAKSEKHPSLQALLIDRLELMPVLAYSVFWKVPSPLRAKILQRFSVSRRLVQQTIADAVTGGGINLDTDDPHEKEALQFLIGKEHARNALADDILADLRAGKRDEAIEIIFKGAEISQETAQRIFEDAGGEPLAVLCKAINLGRLDFAEFLTLIDKDDAAVSRSEEERERIAAIFDSMPIDSAEVALRYWDRPREQVVKRGKGLKRRRQKAKTAAALEIIPLVQETTSPELVIASQEAAQPDVTKPNQVEPDTQEAVSQAADDLTTGITPVSEQRADPETIEVGDNQAAIAQDNNPEARQPEAGEQEAGVDLFGRPVPSDEAEETFPEVFKIEQSDVAALLDVSDEEDEGFPQVFNIEVPQPDVPQDAADQAVDAPDAPLPPSDLDAEQLVATADAPASEASAEPKQIEAEKEASNGLIGGTLDLRQLEQLAGDDSADARRQLFDHLANILLSPGRELTDFERTLIDEILVGLIDLSDTEIRIKMADNLATSSNAPTKVLSFLAKDDIKIARPILSNGSAFSDEEWIEIVRSTGAEHKKTIAQREMISQKVIEALIDSNDMNIVFILFDNSAVSLSSEAIEKLVNWSKTEQALHKTLLDRPEITARHAHMMFWWVSSELRDHILQTFSVDPQTLERATADAISAVGDDTDQEQIGMIDPGPFADCDEAELNEFIKALRRKSETPLGREFANLLRISEATAEKILTDPSCEALAICCRALCTNRAQFSRVFLVVDHKRFDRARPTGHLGQASVLFDRLDSETARRTLQFWNLQELLDHS